MYEIIIIINILNKCVLWFSFVSTVFSDTGGLPPENLEIYTALLINFWVICLYSRLCIFILQVLF
jgi:hypothetical protein